MRQEAAERICTPPKVFKLIHREEIRMNEIQPFNDAEVLPAMRPALDRLHSDGMAKLREHAEMQTMAMQYGEFITKTGACPEIYRGKPLDAAAAILRGVQRSSSSKARSACTRGR